MSDKQLIDPVMLKGLVDVARKENFLASLICKFDAYVKAGIDDMDKALLDKDIQVFRKLAHQLTGSSASIGATALQLEFLNIRDLTDEQIIEKNVGITRVLKDTFEKTGVALKHYSEYHEKR